MSATDPGDLMKALLVMKPQPSPYPPIRVGKVGDGAYLIPDDLAGITACFSPGVNNFKDFEDYMTDTYGMDCHMCDKSSDLEKFRTPLKDGKQTFKKKWLDINGADDSISLKQWVEELSPSGSDDLILQIDIEGAEYRNIINTPTEILKRFRIIVIELHALRGMLDAKKFKEIYQPFFAKLDEVFVCVHAHPNNCCGEFNVPGTDLNLPAVHELTYLRKDRLAAHGGVMYPPLVPHPLDIVRNVAKKAPIVLNEGWTAGGRMPDAKIKMLEDEIDYLKYLINTPDATEREEISNLNASLYSLSQQAYQSFLPAVAPEADDAPLVEVAQGKPFVISTAHRNMPRHGVVRSGGGFFFHTDAGINQSITIDLGSSFTLGKLKIENRKLFPERASMLFYVPHQSAGRGTEAAYPVNISEDFLTGKASSCETPIPGFEARYVTIFSPLRTTLHFAGVEIYAAARAG